MAEVKIIRGGNYNIEPQGPDWQGALPDCVPRPDPEIPFEKYRSFLAPFRNGSVDPLAVSGDDNVGTGQTVILPFDGATAIRSVLPAASDMSDLLLVSPRLVSINKGSASLCIKLRPNSPPPAPGQEFFLIFVLVSPFRDVASDLFGIIYQQAIGQFAFFTAIDNINAATSMAPWVEGDEYEFTCKAKPLSTGETCFSCVAKQNGVVVNSTSFTVPALARFPMYSGTRIVGSTNVPAAMFEVVLREIAVGYQPIVTPTSSCP